MNIPALNRSQWGVIFVSLSAVGFAAKGIFAKLAYREGVDPSTLLTLRMLSVLPIYVFGLFWFGRNSPLSRPPVASRDFMTIALMGLLGFDISAVLDFEGLARVPAGTERLILFLYPTFVVFLSSIVHRKPIGRRELVASGLAYAGIALVTEGSGSSDPVGFTGVGLVLGSALFYAFYLVGMEGLLRRVDPLWLTSVVMVLSTAAIFIQSALSGSLHPQEVNSRALVQILLMGIFSTAIPTFLVSLGISMIGASRAAVISFFGPVATLLMAMVFLGEKLSFLQGTGTVVVLCGVALVIFRNASPLIWKKSPETSGTDEEFR